LQPPLFFYPEDRCRKFIRKFGKYLQIYRTVIPPDIRATESGFEAPAKKKERKKEKKRKKKEKKRGHSPARVVKVKQFRNRPRVAQRVPGGLGSQISMTFGI